MITLTIYLLISAFTLGGYCGATVERSSKIPVTDIFPMIFLSLIWPVLLAVFVCLRAKEKIQ
jgi:hypothetical protein